MYERRIHLHGNLGNVMCRMRTWLDRHGYEPDVFRYYINVDRVTVHVEFKIEAEANAFAEAFAEAATGLSQHGQF